MSKQVALIDLGSKLSVNLSKLARKLNSKQETFVFSAPAKIPNATLQEPDFYNEYYNLDRLFGILRSIDLGQQFEFVVGITHVKISEKQTIRKKERGYFSLSDGERISVVSTNKTMLRCCSPLKSQYQYLSYLIICELLLNLSDDLVFSHGRTSYCLFDDCEDRSIFRECIETSEICEFCEPKLWQSRRIDSQTIDDAKRVLSWCRKNDLLLKSKLVAIDPVLALGLGAFLGWAISYLNPGKWYMLALLVLTAILAWVRTK